jgi:hypothetical protein
MTSIHPSKRLQDGEASDFISAMRLYREQMEHENAMTERLSRKHGQPITEWDRKCMANLRHDACKASEAESIYRTHLSRVNAAVAAELRAKGDDTFNQFADALDAGDYAQLAV